MDNYGYHKSTTTTAAANASDSSPQPLPKYVLDILKNAVEKGLPEGDVLDVSYRCRGIRDNMASELCEWIAKLANKLKSLNVSGNGITSTGASMIVDVLTINHIELHSINLMENSIGDAFIPKLGEYIKFNKSMAIVNLSGINISESGIEMLAPYIFGHASLKMLFFQEIGAITDKSIPLLVKMIESSHIEDLDLFGTSSTQRNLLNVPLARNIIQNGAEEFDFSQKECRPLTFDDVITICEMIRKFGVSNMKNLYLSQTQIPSKAVSLLFGTLKEVKANIKMINMYYTHINDEIMNSLGEFLQDDDSVSHITLSFNLITDNGIEILSNYLFGNVGLEILDLSGNRGITDVSVPHFIEIGKKTAITNINLSDTAISGDSILAISDVVRIPVEKRGIPIKSSSKSAAKTKII